MKRNSGSEVGGEFFIEPLLHRLMFSPRLFYLNRTANSLNRQKDREMLEGASQTASVYWRTKIDLIND
jgi:hypothetical protein